MAESSRPSFPPSATVLSIENVEDPFNFSWKHPLIHMIHPASLSSQTWCHFITWTLVLLIAVTKEQDCILSWVFWRLYRQRKVSVLMCRQQLVPVMPWWQHGKQWVFYCDITHSIVNIQGMPPMKSSKIFYGAILHSKMAVLEPRYPMPHRILPTPVKPHPPWPALLHHSAACLTQPEVLSILARHPPHTQFHPCPTHPVCSTPMHQSSRPWPGM